MTSRRKEVAGRQEMREGDSGLHPCTQSCAAPANCQNSSFLNSSHQRYETELSGTELIPCLTGVATLELGVPAFHGRD